MRRVMRWVGWTGLAIASMVLVFSLAIAAGNAIAAKGAGCSLHSSLAASGSATSGCPMSGGLAQEPAESGPTVPEGLVAGSEEPTSSDAGVPIDPSLPVPPARSFSCH